MTEVTTIRVEKPVVDWLNTLKAHLVYNSGKRLTLNEALMSILAEVDWLYLKKQSVADSKETEVKKRINKRIDQFWGVASKEKPSIRFAETKNVIIKEKPKEKNRRQSYL